MLYILQCRRQVLLTKWELSVLKMSVVLRSTNPVQKISLKKLKSDISNKPIVKIKWNRKNYTLTQNKSGKENKRNRGQIGQIENTLENGKFQSNYNDIKLHKNLGSQEDLCTGVYSIFIINSQKNWDQPRCPSINIWLSELWYMCNRLLLPAIKKVNYWYLHQLEIIIRELCEEQNKTKPKRSQTVRFHLYNIFKMPKIRSEGKI